METISHKGKITDITPLVTTVEIISESACASCHARGLCAVSESSRKIVEVPTSGWDSWQPGDEVNILLKSSMGHKAVWVAYVAPLVVLMAVLMGLMALGAGELASGLGGIAAVGMYYFCIWLLRGRLKSEYVFTLEKINQNN